MVPGISLVVDGHTHTMVEEPILITNRITGKIVPVVQARHWGLYMGKSVLRFKNGELTGGDYNLMPINVQYREKLADGSSVYHFVDREIPEDQVLLAKLQAYVDKVDAVLNEPIGRATAPFLNAKTRQEETAIGDMVCRLHALVC